MKSVETTGEDAQKLVEAVPKADGILGEHETIAFQAFPSLTVSSKIHVECASKQGVLQARVKGPEPPAAKQPIVRSVARKAERGEADELTEKVLDMFEEINGFSVPIFDENSGEDCIPLSRWIEPVKEAEIALDIARCEMTVEDVDDLLARIYIEMNRLVVVHAKNKEQKKRMALEVSTRIREYAGILLESECEVRLAVERARAKSVIAKRFTPSDAEYLASLTPGSSHIPSCDGSCVSSYLPHRMEGNDQDEFIPELARSEGSGCSTASEIPSTPRTLTTELEPHIGIMPNTADLAKLGSLKVVSVKSSPTKVVRKTLAGKAWGGKPAWRF
ncbi:hypothetical protein RSOLAG22IIIB_12380 [Rhizoctonia solani]|uniref:Uncharacterized protein n=1 Tax=Rhizoctonia solani TaxID=456999 RepID=A0A0K6GDN1_9AGAM|nr:hypothetical protein RSOLAG22IIIB_12380 [Rhizoctonia solani]